MKLTNFDRDIIYAFIKLSTYNFYKKASLRKAYPDAYEKGKEIVMQGLKD